MAVGMGNGACRWKMFNNRIHAVEPVMVTLRQQHQSKAQVD